MYCLQIREKERMAMEERDPAISQAKKRKKIIASLPKLFNMIDMMFHSKNRSVMTKEELMSNIVSNHRDIIDRSKIHFFKKQLTGYFIILNTKPLICFLR
jgi:chromatin licensing and DNA replication factor 1